MLPIDDISCDVLILGAGGAGMLAALHGTMANPAARIVISPQPCMVHRALAISVRYFRVYLIREP